MKNFFNILLAVSFVFLVSSCDPNPIEKLKEEESKKETSIQTLEEADTVLYQVFFSEDNYHTYLINSETQLVEYKLNNDSGGLKTSFIMFLVMTVIIMILSLALSKD